MTTGILTPSATRALLDRLGHRPKRQLGQNFLIDGNIVRKSLALAAIEPGERVVEIGPGLGTLTAALLEAGARVYAIERDPVLAGHLRETLAKTHADRFSLFEGDAVEHPLAAMPSPENEPFTIVANLPYAISTPWIDAVLAGALPTAMVLMLQTEAAQRFAAAPGSKTFGAISVFLQSAYRVMPGHAVSPGCFYPRPDVDSRLFCLQRLDAPFLFPEPAKKLIRAIFQQRRKQLGALVRQHAEADPVWLDELNARGFSPQSRAEEIPVGLWQTLSVRVPPAGLT